MTSIERLQPPIRILDIMVVIAESWKLLLFIPVLAGFLGFGISQFEPSTYQSTALNLITFEGAAFSPDLVSQALKSVPAAPAVNEVLAGLRTGEPVQRTSRTAAVSVTLALSDQTIVQPTLYAVLKEYQKRYISYAVDETRLALEAQIEVLNQEIAASLKAIDRLEELIDRIVSKHGDPAALLSAIAPLEARVEELELQKRAINRRIPLLADFLVTEKPSPAVKVAGPPTVTVTIFAFFAAIAIIGIFLFTRERLRSLAKLPGGAEKIRRIQTAFGLHSKPD